MAIDKASYGLVCGQVSLSNSKLEIPLGPGADRFKAAWRHTQGLTQITDGEEIGLGVADYLLIEI